jgi:hypothetical protein
MKKKVMETARDILRKIVGKSGQNVLPCKVESVDGIYCDVVPVDTDLAPIKQVRLNANKEGLVITPKVGSIILVVMITENDGFVGMFSEVEKVKFIDINGFEYSIENGKLSVKNKDYSLRKAFDDIIAAIGKLTVTTGVGPSGFPINIAEFNKVGQNLDKLIIDN